MLVIPAIDLRGNRVVRLFQGDYGKEKVYGEDPVVYAKHFAELGARRIHIVDLDGAKEGKPVHEELIKRVVKSVKADFEVGGGIREENHIEGYLSSGVSQVILGTKAVQSLDWLSSVAQKFPGRIIVSVDIKGGKVAVSGWLETSEVDYIEFLKALNQIPLFGVIITVVERDGTQRGIATDVLEKALSVTRHRLTLAGGISTLEDIKTALKYADKGLFGVITGRAIYEGSLDLKEALRLCDGSPVT